MWVSSFPCLSVFSKFSILSRNYLVKKEKKNKLYKLFLGALPALVVTLNISHHPVWMLTWTVWGTETNVSWHRVSVGIPRIKLCCCHSWFRWMLVVGCLLLWVLFMWTREFTGIFFPPFPAKALLPRRILSFIGLGVPWHYPGAQHIRASLNRLRTTRWMVTTPSLNITRHLAQQPLLEQPSLGWYTHHRLSSPWSQGPNECEWVCFRFIKISMLLQE